MELTNIDKVDFIRDLYNNNIEMIIINELGKRTIKNVLGVEIDVDMVDIWSLNMN